MQKYLPFVFPLAALVIVIFLAVRWFTMQTDRPSAEIGEGVEIEDLTPAEEDTILRGTGDFQQAELTGEEAQGGIRYETRDGRVVFSVNADVAQPTDGFYQVWVRSGETLRKAFRLELTKGGFAGSAALNQDALPLEIVVSQEMTDDDAMEKEILRGAIAE